ncbi:molybdate ABC transporter substrate-binding protein [Nostoc sp.]|uniref:molybdate ABC transporter substrate-binding protein n=1 Tax=Nostoc sp. TaxID=1180 RepID=UPI002FF5B5AA
MKKKIFVLSLIASTFSLTFPIKAFAVDLYAAGSLTNALTEVKESFTKETGIPVTTTFNGSGTLAQQIQDELAKTGKSADVFASADIGNAQKLYDKGLSNPVVNFTSNRLVAVVRPGLSVTPENLLDFLLNPDINVGTSTPIKDPSGDYAFQVFDKADKIKPGSSQTLKEKALQLVGGNPSAPVLPTGKNSLVYFLKETQKADIFLSYYTSGKAAQSLSDGNDLQLIELPDYLATKADYGLTVLKNADPDSEKLAAYILSPEGQAILARNGFSSPSRLTSVPEHQGVGGIVFAVGAAFVLQKKLASAKKQQVSVGGSSK